MDKSSEQVMIESFTSKHEEPIHRPASYLEACIMYNELSQYTTESYTDSYNMNFLLSEAHRLYKQESEFKWPYSISPYFVDEEVEQLKGFYFNETGGTPPHPEERNFGKRTRYQKIVDLQNQLRDTEDPDEITRIKSELERLGIYDTEDMPVYENYMYYSFRHNECNPISWDTKVRNLMTQLRGVDDPDDIAFYKQKVVDLGWNPEIDYTPENKSKAIARMESVYSSRYNAPLNIQYLTDRYNEDYIINENAKQTVKPIHIVLIRGTSPFSAAVSAVTDSDFSHAAFGMDNDFSRLYSFNMNKSSTKGFLGGLSLESIKNYPQDNRLAVFSFFVKEDDWNKINDRIKYMMDHMKNTAYSFVNLLTLPFKKINLNMPDAMICSQFVDSLFKIGNVDISKKDSSHVTPGDLYRSAITNNKVYKVFDGITKDFNHKRAERYIEKMAKTAKPYTESTNILDEYFYPVVCEAKKFPFEITPEGDVLFTNPKVDFDAEYSASHKLLLKYDKANNMIGMKYELARLYYMNYVLEKRIYSRAYRKQKEKNVKTRARVLNDFNKYIQVVLKNEPNFNFAEYYEDSIFYAHTVEIKGSTIMKTKDIIKYIL